MCSDCKIPLVGELPSAVPPIIAEVKPDLLEGLKCLQHPNVAAVSICRACSSGVCGTCDFLISGMHFCPKCIDGMNDEAISPLRRRLAVVAIILAIYCTLVGIFTITGMLYRLMGGAEYRLARSVFVFYGVYLPSIVGTVLAFSAFERRLKNTTLIWTALIWNATLTAIFILLEIAVRILR